MNTNGILQFLFQAEFYFEGFSVNPLPAKLSLREQFPSTADVETVQTDQSVHSEHESFAPCKSAQS